MGKSQKQRAMRRHNPMRVPDSHLPKGLASAESSSTKTEAILPILQKMDSADSVERKWACVAVSNLIQNDPSTRRLLQGKNVVGALISRLTDSEEEVVVEAMGALRNLCIDGGFDICAEMYNKNILTPMKTFIPKISGVMVQYLENPKTAPDNARQVVYEFADNVITTLWCLSETSNKALNTINSINLVPFLMSFLVSREKLSLGPVTAAAHCLYVLSDDNAPAVNELRLDAGYISCLLDITRMNVNIPNGTAKELSDHRLATLGVLVTGILRNINPLPPPSPASTIDIDKDIVLPFLTPIISALSLPDITNRVQQLLTEQHNAPSIDHQAVKNAPKNDHKTAQEIELEQLEAKLRTVQLALQILTGACATLPDPESESADDEDEDKDMEDTEVDNENDDDNASEVADIEMSGDPASVTEQKETTLHLPPLVPPLLALICPTTLSFPPLASPSPHPPTTSALSAVHVSAMECLNNIFLSLSTQSTSSVSNDKEAGLVVWNSIWNALSAVGTEIAGLGQEKRKEMWDVAVGVLWSVGNVWKGVLVPTQEQISLLTQLCDTTADIQLRVKCIGTLECLAQHPDSIEFNKIISTYLISILPTSTSPSLAGTEPLIQAVSALIDIYSDETLPYDCNFQEGRYLHKLSDSLDGVKKAVKAINRKQEGGRELRRRGEEVRENLLAFIHYRRDLRL